MQLWPHPLQSSAGEEESAALLVLVGDREATLGSKMSPVSLALWASLCLSVLPLQSRDNSKLGGGACNFHTVTHHQSLPMG